MLKSLGIAACATDTDHTNVSLASNSFIHYFKVHTSSKVKYN